MDQNKKIPTVGAESRREFLRRATTSAAAVVATAQIVKTPVYGQNQAPSPGRVIGANDRIVVGYVGVGGQGMAHVNSQKNHASENNIVQAAVCDVSKTRVSEAKSKIGGECVGYDNYRKLLDRKDIDAVVVSTVDHWHTPVSVHAMVSGKHVYVEKPMTRYLGEAFELYDTVKSTGRIFTIGSQGCSDGKWHKAAELIRAGKIGPIVLCQGSYMRNNNKGEWNYDIKNWCTAEDVDWTQWMGNVHKKVDFNADHYFRWRKYYPYCAGLLGDLFPHKLHPYMLATGNPEWPTRVNAIGTKKVGTDKNTPGTYERDVPEFIQLIAEFPSGVSLHVMSSTVNEKGAQEMIRGHKATLDMQGNRIQLTPERPFTEEVDPEIIEGIKPTEDIAVHEKNWFDCIRSGGTPNCGIDLAAKVQTVISLGEMSDRLGLTCHFDPKSRKITTADGKEVKALTYGSTELS
jgi:predicted dehydrogenase